MRRAAQFYMRQGLWTEEAGRPEAKSCPSEYPNGLFCFKCFCEKAKSICRSAAENKEKEKKKKRKKKKKKKKKKT